MNLRIERVDQTNWRQVTALSVSLNQKNFIESNTYSILEAHYIADWYPVGLYSDDSLVGFAMYGCYENNSVWLDRLMIDQNYQGQGFGERFLKYLIEHLKNNFKIKNILLSFTPSNQVAKIFYEKKGFSNTNEIDENGELIYSYNCSEV
ncbi:GNAT family N-acetyltransferase [Listeria weihenstephanensis]|uniref:GNAT family N-acetyltransferase n=1 Tax=Listeria weihenstephanensis TaxID=1006155 RepID=A0A841Z5A7_9LIST|nr:GNAT family N-acetyltransferase [Listeria weihenstephanensis]MBC1500434.1 GNAT family N-acetyltransferase [Listeria weihenstephanensis]